ncbi:MAG: retroviral-like aspartic protease family protein [Defluviitaleaceae bacterium]|nr:retroviral-like aspartic protease family protein [Defluviitaleaceae bacterium]
MNDLQFTLDNIKDSPLQGFQLKAVAVSAKGYSQGFCTPFEALIDSGAFHTCISKTIMDKILDKVFDENGNRLQEVGKSNAMGVYGKSSKESIYILPHFYLGSIHLTDVAVTVLNTKNIQCLIGRSILQQCVLTLDPEQNNMYFNFKESLKQQKRLVDNVMPFADVLQFAEFSAE